MRSQRWLQPLVLIPLLAFAIRLIPGPRVIDDAYITFRYARNPLAGLGPFYNPGEPVLGTTTPLYALILAALGLLTGGSAAPFPLLATVVNAVADALTCALLVGLDRQLGKSRAGIASALVWALAPWSVTFAIGGMETSVFIASPNAGRDNHSWMTLVHNYLRKDRQPSPAWATSRTTGMSEMAGIAVPTSRILRRTQ